MKMAMSSLRMNRRHKGG